MASNLAVRLDKIKVNFLCQSLTWDVHIFTSSFKFWEGLHGYLQPDTKATKVGGTKSILSKVPDRVFPTDRWQPKLNLSLINHESDTGWPNDSALFIHTFEVFLDKRNELLDQFAPEVAHENELRLLPSCHGMMVW